MELQTRDIDRALCAKGFVKDDSGDHPRYTYPGTLMTTKVSHGSGNSIGDNLISLMAKQLKLTRAQFVDLVKCPMSEDGYRGELTKQGRLTLVPDPEAPSTAAPTKKKKKKKKS